MAVIKIPTILLDLCGVVTHTSITTYLFFILIIKLDLHIDT